MTAKKKPAPKKVQPAVKEDIVVDEITTTKQPDDNCNGSQGDKVDSESILDETPEIVPDCYDDNGTVNQPYVREILVIKPKKAGFWKRISNFFKRLF